MASVRRDIATINRFVDEPLLVLNGRTVETDLRFFLRRLARAIRYNDDEARFVVMNDVERFGIDDLRSPFVILGNIHDNKGHGWRKMRLNNHDFMDISANNFYARELNRLVGETVMVLWKYQYCL